MAKAIYDYDGTMAVKVKKMYDYDGAKATALKKGYDWNGTTATHVYAAFEEYLFNAGKFADISGFSLSKCTGSNNGDTYTVTTSGNVFSIAVSNKKIDITDVQTITANFVGGSQSYAGHWQGAWNAWCRMGVASTTPSLNSSGFLQNATKYVDLAPQADGLAGFSGIRNLDVSSLTGEYYLFFTVGGSGSANGKIIIDYIKQT